MARWNWRREDPGRTYNYNELCPLTLGMVIRQVTGQSMAAFAERVLWQPMGAESQATWTTDSEGNEFNCIGFAATLRDWARLGRLVAQRGQMNGVQVVSEAWIRECTRWTERDQQVRHGVAARALDPAGPLPAGWPNDRQRDPVHLRGGVGVEQVQGGLEPSEAGHRRGGDHPRGARGAWD